MARSTDGGRMWELYDLPRADYPRNMFVDRDGCDALLMCFFLS